jgi:hypothetical protein
MKKYFTIIIPFLFTGCELVVDVDIPIEQRQLVLNSFFTPDSVWRAKLSASQHILDDGPYELVEDAQIIVMDGEDTIDTLTYDSLGYYTSNNGKPAYNKSYTIRATAANYRPVESTSSCPKPITAEFSSLQTGVGEIQEPVHSFTIKFIDSPERDFYQVMAIAEYRQTNPYTGQGFLNRYNAHIWSEDPAINAKEIANSEGFFFSDALFNGKEFSLNVKMSPNHWGTSTKIKYYVFLRSLNEDYYRYKTTSLLQNYTSSDPFAQPVKVFNNIENGFGIFAGYSQAAFQYEN